MPQLESNLEAQKVLLASLSYFAFQMFEWKLQHSNASSKHVLLGCSLCINTGKVPREAYDLSTLEKHPEM